MKKIKKIGFIIFAILLLGGILSFSACFNGCSTDSESESGFFKYRIEDDGVRITDLTAKGYEQEILIVPTTINGKPVVKLLTLSVGFSGAYIRDTQLRKVYIQHNVRDSNYFFTHQKNLEKIIVLSYEDGDSSEDYLSCGKAYVRKEEVKPFLPPIYSANISFKYNYEFAPRNGYHWIDDLDYGSKIVTVPENPVRAGYSFLGWYKDTDCTEKWDFAKDTTVEAIVDLDGKPVYQETVLYAGWQVR
ncbi:MAG: InlB B-repeat-containing protein [Firmicutes bacterium]|nr:InlB B-repeat-containing protein [Bacillota bacterium]